MENIDSRMRQIVSLTESDIHRIVKQVINEIGYRGAALAHGANYNAQQDYDINKNQNARKKMKKSEQITNPALTLAIRDNFPNLLMEFVEKNEATHRAYPVDFLFQEIKFIDYNRVVFSGQMTIVSDDWQKGTIEFNFNTQEFYRVSYSDKTTRSRKLHKLIIHNEERVNEVLSFISKYLYATEDYENNININGSTRSKER